jgi:histidine triad (HIT) family protein
MPEGGSGCVFCDIVAGKAPAYRILETDSALVILDIQPLAKGHCLVLSKRHVQFWHELSPEESRELFAAAHAVARRLATTLDPEFVCLYARGRRIPHTHLFLVPTFPGDPTDRVFNALEGVQESAPVLAELRTPEEMESTARALRDDS